MNKSELQLAIIAELKTARDNAAQAADNAKATATDKENIAENKYDTLGLEAAYLAHGQSDRILQLEEDIRLFEQIDVTESNKVALGSLVELEDDNGEISYVFLGPSSGGFKISHNNQTIQIVTPAAPLGKKLLHAEDGDEITLEVGNETRAYLISAVT